MTNGTAAHDGAHVPAHARCVARDEPRSRAEPQRRIGHASIPTTLRGYGGRIGDVDADTLDVMRDTTLACLRWTTGIGSAPAPKLTDAQLDQMEQATEAFIRDELADGATDFDVSVEHRLLQLIDEVKELRAQIAAVRAVHRPQGRSEPGCIDGCISCHDEMGWPCDTIKGLGGEL